MYLFSIEFIKDKIKGKAYFVLTHDCYHIFSFYKVFYNKNLTKRKNQYKP